MPPVLLATAAHREQIVATVAVAFSHDPAWTFICGEEYERVAPLFAGALFDARVDAGTVWMTADGAAVAMWDDPAAQRQEGEELWSRFRREAGSGTSERLARYNAALAACHLPQPFWYLGVLATRPAGRMQGLATAVMQPGLERADRAGLKACLETSTIDNKRFYARRGFADAVEVDLADGPATWWLTRHPSEARLSR